jgi:hypothetical protein
MDKRRDSAQTCFVFSGKLTWRDQNLILALHTAQETVSIFLTITTPRASQKI